MFDLPRTPLSSLASLQHADTSKLHFHAARSIAHSRVQVGIADATKIHNQLAPARFNTTSKFQIDTSWAANESLWDRYFFSGMNWGDTAGQSHSTHDNASEAFVDGNISELLTNPRMVKLEQPSRDDLDEIRSYDKIGKHLGIRGAFNVNSTSIEAWKAVLASLSGREISILNGAELIDTTLDNDLTPLSRLTTPAGTEIDDYTGFRALDSDDLENLATKIVEQVRLRGPFMGLSDFVNRRLVIDETGESGALQAAIDQSELNSNVKIGSTEGNRLKQSGDDANEGMARYLTQGDILTPLAPIMATRSDTFVIRTYGESLDSKGKVQARAWCEAIVQRTPNWVEDSVEPYTVKHSDYPLENSTAEPILRQWMTNPNLSAANKKFGRRFKIQSFRWMSEKDV